jgi:hypothetical protein
VVGVDLNFFSNPSQLCIHLLNKGKDTLAGTTCEATLWIAYSAIFCKRAAFGVSVATKGFEVTVQVDVARSLTELFSFDGRAPSGLQNHQGFSTYDKGMSGQISVTVVGQSFSSQDTVSVRIGGSGCRASAWISSSSILCKIPRTSCRVEATVVTAGVVIGTHSSAFTYDPPPIVALAVGGKKGQGKGSTCAAFDLGHLKCWGGNPSGQLGQDTTSTSIGKSAGSMGDNLPVINLGNDRTVRSVAVSSSATGAKAHVCAILDDGTLKCWGDNAKGQLGQGHTNTVGDGIGVAMSSLNPISLSSAPEVTASAVATGDEFTCVILGDTRTGSESLNGKMKCFGSNSHGQLGYGDTTDRGLFHKYTECF